MNKKTFYLFLIFTMFVSNVYSAYHFVARRRVLSVALCQLPSDNVMQMLGVRSQSIPLIEEVSDHFDAEYLQALNLFNNLKDREKQFDLGRGLGLVFDFREENTLKFFLLSLFEIAKGLRTSILHLLVELKCIKDLQQCIDYLEKNKDYFNFYNIDPVPNNDQTYPPHKHTTPLFYAAYLNNYEKAKILIENGENGADIYVRNQFGYSLLHLAIYHNNIDLLKLIINKFNKHKEEGIKCYFDVLNDQRNETGHSPLYFAVWKGNIQILQILLEQKVCLCLRDKARQTVFHILVKNYINDSDYRQNAEKIFKMLVDKAYRYVPRTDRNHKFPKGYLDKDDPLRRQLESVSSAGLWTMVGY